MKPLIEGHRNTVQADRHLEYYLRNKGLGPAVIKKYYFFIDKKHEPSIKTCEQFFDRIRGEAKFIFKVSQSSVTHKSAGSALLPGESERIFMMRIEPISNEPSSLALMESKTDEVLGRFSMAIEYESIYRTPFTFDPEGLLGSSS